MIGNASRSGTGTGTRAGTTRTGITIAYAIKLAEPSAASGTLTPLGVGGN